MPTRRQSKRGTKRGGHSRDTGRSGRGDTTPSVGKRPAEGDPRILIAGEAAVSIELGDTIDATLNARVHALDRRLAESPFPGLIEAVPTYRALLVHFEPGESSFDQVLGHLSSLVAEGSAEDVGAAPLKHVPTVYDGEDLEIVARYAGLSRSDVIALHRDTEYRVYMLGFSPGFPYLGLVPETIAAPRLATPRVRVPAGSVAIAGRQTGVYPSPTPGGWNLIGRSSLPLFDPSSDPPSFFLPGDRVRFVEVATAGEPSSPRRAARPQPGEPMVEVLEPGLLTTVQDLGRHGYQRYGVPVAGAADPAALRAANRLVGNAPGRAALECTVTGPTLRFLKTTMIAVCGGDLGGILDRDDLGAWEVPRWSSFLVRTGQRLRFTGRQSGCRAYVAVAGGIEVKPVLGSAATYLTAELGGVEGRALRRGDILYASPPARRLPPSRWPPSLVPNLAPTATVRFVYGLQHDVFTEEAKGVLTASEYTVGASSDRMGLRLQGPAVAPRSTNEIVTDGLVLGTIQVLPDGQPVVMLADHGTTGGYPKIGAVVQVDIPRLAQLVPGDRLRFEPVSVAAARELREAARLEESRALR